MSHKILYTLILTITAAATAETTTPYCPENLTRVELRPVLRNHIITLPTAGIFNSFLKRKIINITYFDYEKRISFKLLNKCCMGYRMTLYGICEPICEQVRCDQQKYQQCVEPNRCGCENGYKYSDADNTTTQCMPICQDVCEQNEYCSAPNTCVCMANYIRNVTSKLCQARCRPGIEWDAQTLTCVQKLQANVAVIAAEMDILVTDDAESNSVDNFEGAGHGEVPVFVGTWQNQSASGALESCAENDEGCVGKYWHNCIYISLGIAVVLLFVTLGVAGRYFWRRRTSEHVVILEPNDFYGDYLERNQMLVY